jgi:hypothetical protein
MSELASALAGVPHGLARLCPVTSSSAVRITGRETTTRHNLYVRVRIEFGAIAEALLVGGRTPLNARDRHFTSQYERRVPAFFSRIRVRRTSDWAAVPEVFIVENSSITLMKTFTTEMPRCD